MILTHFKMYCRIRAVTTDSRVITSETRARARSLHTDLAQRRLTTTGHFYRKLCDIRGRTLCWPI